MPGPWYDAQADHEYFARAGFTIGQHYEVEVYDSRGSRQGEILILVTAVASTSSALGLWLEATFIAASDEYFD